MRQITLLCFFPLCFALGGAYFFQTHLLFSPDVAYLMHAASLLLAGGHYVTHIFETNPPLILYLYLPACWLAKTMVISQEVAVRLYFLGIATFSLGLNYILLRRIFSKDNVIALHTFFYTLLWVVVILPFFELEQRESFFVVLMLPYLFSTVLQLQNKNLPFYFSMIIGFLGGIGFALKPFFLVPLVLIELYLMWKKRSFFSWVRIETLMIGCLLIGYVGFLFWKEPNYIHIVLPLVNRYYFIGAMQSWDVFLLNPFVCFTLAMIVSYPFIRRGDHYPELSMILWLALIGMVIAFMIPRTAWFYHVLPALGLSFLLIGHWLGQGLSLYVNSKKTINIILRDSILLLLIMCVIVVAPMIKLFQGFDIFLSYKASGTHFLLEQFFEAQSGEKSITCFTGNGNMDCFPMINHVDAQFVNRFPFFWWLRGVNLRENDPHQTIPALQVAKEKTYLIDAVASDLNNYQPRWVVVDIKSFHDNGSDMISYFMRNPHFHSAWRPYHKVKVIDRFHIYEREPRLIYSSEKG